MKSKTTLLSLIILLSNFFISFNTLSTPTISDTSAFVGFISNPSRTAPLMLNPGGTFTITVNLNQSSLDNPIFLLVNQFKTITLSQEDFQIVSADQLEITLKLPVESLPLLYDLVLRNEGSENRVSNSIKVILPQQPPAFSFIHFSDIHIDNSTERTQKALQLVSEINLIRPDFAIFSGDLIDGWINPNPSQAKDQIPLAISILTKLKIPCFIINGNHDFYYEGNYYWEKYLSPIEKVMSYQFQGVRFVGVNLFDANGLTSNQKADIQNAFKQSTGTRIFFIHCDYQGELPSIYRQNGIDIALRGHEHIGKFENVESTLEIYSDNSIELNSGEPGHYRIIYMNTSGEMAHETEIQTGGLFANFTTFENQEGEIVCCGIIENYGGANFTNLVQEVDVLGSWQIKNEINVSKVETFYNETHTKLLIHTSILSDDNMFYEVLLKPKVQETSLSTQDSTSDSLTSKMSSSQQTTTVGFNFLGIIMILCVIIINKKRSIQK